MHLVEFKDKVGLECQKPYLGIECIWITGGFCLTNGNNKVEKGDEWNGN